MLYRVHYRSRYHSFEGIHKKLVRADSKMQIRDNWHAIMHTDEYSIVKIEEVDKE